MTRTIKFLFIGEMINRECITALPVVFPGGKSK